RIDDYYEYMMKKNQASRPDTLYEVRRYLDKPVASRNTMFSNATSVASEQMFSCAGRIVDDYCTSLDPETVTALMC
ncbi:5877_t:CDS:2, partial [Racocetra persica]